MSTTGFWEFLQKLVDTSAIVVDRPKGSVHPRIPELTYPLDYGYLDRTTSGDGAGIDVWVGSSNQRKVVGMICTVDLGKRDAELKLLLGCSPNEAITALNCHNDDKMQAIWIRCPDEC